MSEKFIVEVIVEVPDDQLLWFSEEPGNYIVCNTFDDVKDIKPYYPESYMEKLREINEEM